jgi:hypothetical protein
MADQKKTLLEMAEELNDMDRDMTSGEADFHDGALKDLRKGKKLKPKDEAKLELLHEKYLAEKPGEEEEEEVPAEEETEGEDDVDF